MTELEFDEMLYGIAEDAAKERYKLHSDGYMPQELGNLNEELATAKFTKDFLDALRKKYVYDAVMKEGPIALATLKNTPANDWVDYLYGNVQSKDPFNKVRQEKFDKFASLIADNVNSEIGDGSNWYNKSKYELRKDAKELGYNIDKKDEYADFLKKVAEFQLAYDRGQIMDEMEDSGWGKFNAYVNPASYEEAQRQVATGEGTEDDLKNMAIIDAAANSLIWGVPGFPSTHRANNVLSRFLNFGTHPIENGINRVANFVNSKSPRLAKLDEALSNPVLTGFVDAGYQGLGEGGRQVLKTEIDPNLDVNYTAPVTAMAMGASRPGMYSAASGFLNSFQGPTMRNIAKGVMKSTRSGNPVEIERKALTDAIDAYEKQLGKSGVDRGISTAEVLARTKGVRAKDILKAFEVKDEEGRTVNLLKKYNDEGTWKWDWDNEKMGLTPESQAKWNNLKAVAGAKLADMGDATPDVKTGLLLGKAIGEIGSRFEPTFKLNPLNPTRAVGMSDYKDMDWYNAMDTEKRAAFEKAIAELTKRKRK